MNLRKLLSAILAGAMVLSLAACGSSASSTAPVAASSGAAASSAAESTAPADPEKQLHVVFVSPLLAHPVFLISKDGFETACKELNIQGDWVGPQNISPEEMAKLVETAVAQKADAIITQGLVPTEPVNMAIEAGIPVLMIDSDLPDVTGRFAFFGKDVTKQAELMYQDVVSRLGENTKLNVSIQVSTLSYQIAHDQINAINAAFEKHPGGYTQVNISESKSEKIKASTEWENTFKAYPEINVCINLAAEAGPACAGVVQEMGIRDKTLVYAVDDIEETLDLVRKDAIDGTIVTSFYNYGYQATYWLYQNLTEGKKPANIINDAGTIMVNKDNIDTYADALKIKTDL